MIQHFNRIYSDLLFTFLPLIQDPLAPVIGDIEAAGDSGVSILVVFVDIACMVAVVYSGYKVFFGDSKSGIITFITVVLIASLIATIAASL